MIVTAQELTDLLRQEVLIELARAPMPPSPDMLAWTIGMIVKGSLNRLKATDYLPVSFVYKDITVEFERMHTFPKFRVTVIPA